MLRRLMPYVFAGLTGVVSGVYIFKPLFRRSCCEPKPVSPMNMSTTSPPEVPGKPPAPSPSPHSSAK